MRTQKYGALYAAPQALWLAIFFVAPLLIIFVFSFLERDLFGGVLPSLSIESYRTLASSNLLIITGRTLWVSLVATALTIFIAIPCSYSIAKSKNQALKLFLIILPFWTNFVVRVFAWMSVLGSDGVVNDFLKAIGVIHNSVQLLYNQGAVILVLVYMYLPYAILPLFSTIDKFDFSLLEAARDLGATRFQSMTRVLLPNIRTGIVTAILFTFIPIFGAYAVPLLVGGKDSYMLGNVIADQITKSRNWPLAASISMVVMIFTGLAAVIYSYRVSHEKPPVFQDKEDESIFGHIKSIFETKDKANVKKAHE